MCDRRCQSPNLVLNRICLNIYMQQTSSLYIYIAVCEKLLQLPVNHGLDELTKLAK